MALGVDILPEIESDDVDGLVNMEDNIADSLALGPEPGQSDASYLQPEALNLIAQTFSYNNVGGKIL